MRQGAMAMIVMDQVRGVNISGVFPGVVGMGIALSLQEVLQAFIPPEGSVIDDGLHFVLRLISYEIRWWADEIRTMGRGFDVRG